MTSAIAVAVLVAGGVYLLLQRGLLRVTLGFVLLGHAANLVLLAAGGTDRRRPPLLGGDADLTATADPLPQAFVLTAIVITFAITVHLVALAGSGADDEEPENDFPAAADGSGKPAGDPEPGGGDRV
ncbi:MAG: sodium:proton antiporter [Kineosporiaceae bacterium]